MKLRIDFQEFPQKEEDLNNNLKATKFKRSIGGVNRFICLWLGSELMFLLYKNPQIHPRKVDLRSLPMVGFKKN